MLGPVGHRTPPGSYRSPVTTPRPPIDDQTSSLTLHEAARELGVHYMTAYRYIRLGQIPAVKAGNQWQIRRHDLEQFRTLGADRPTPDRDHLVELLERALIDGDEPAAWRLLEDAIGSGLRPPDAYVELIRPAMCRIGERWAAGELTIAHEHKASAVVTRLVGRLGHRFFTPGRRRGRAVVGAPVGDQHILPSAMFCDLLRLEGLDVVDLGAGNTLESFRRAIERSDGARVVCVTTTTSGLDEVVRQLTADLRALFPGLAVAVGGAAVRDEAHARALGSEFHEADPRLAASQVAGLLGSR
jgi:MerR family transcriptional regulator, light-induced transcriptional regulator